MIEMEETDGDVQHFIEAFSKPTKIYRLLNEYHTKHYLPLFLNRNLTYAKYKKWRPNKRKTKRRTSFKNDRLLGIVDRLTEEKSGRNHYVTFSLSGFYDRNLDGQHYAEIKIIHKETRTQLSTLVVDVNPNEISKRNSVIKLSAESLDLITMDGKPQNNSHCLLQFKVEVFGNDQKSNLYEVEWNLFDPETHNLIPDGDYEIPFTKGLFTAENLLPAYKFPWTLKFFKQKSRSSDLSEANGQKYLSITSPKIRIHLDWPKDLLSTFTEKENLDPYGLKLNRRIYTRSHSTGNISRSSSANGANGNTQQITYRFIYENYIQKTETWNRLICPWCSLKCTQLYILLKHLSLCHTYFKFYYVPGTNETRIDVKVRKLDPKMEFDPLSREGTLFNGRTPKKRRSMSRVIVCRPERHKPRLVEFTLSYNGAYKKRKFYHSVTGLPVLPAEMDENSDDETCPDWLIQHTTKQIEDFIDVNTGETDIMKLWNLHIQRNRYIGNVQIPDAVKTFIEVYGAVILQRSLYRNCLMHLTALVDYELLSPNQFYEAVRCLQSTMCVHENGRNAVKRSFEEQQEHLAKKFKKPPTVEKKSRKFKKVNHTKMNNNDRELRSQSRKLRQKTEMKYVIQKKEKSKRPIKAVRKFAT